MLMIVMSLAISLISMQNLYVLQQERNTTNPNDHAPQKKSDAKHKTDPIPTAPPVTPVEIPSGENAWAVQIVSRGGFTGSGRGDLTITSDGMLIWNGPDGSCSRKLSDEATQALAEVVLAADFASWTAVSPSGLCRDCYVTSIVVQHRDAAGVIIASWASWDDASQTKLPADLKAIYESLMAQRGCKLQ